MYRLRCDCCNVKVYAIHYGRHLRSRKHLENVRQNVPECYRETDENKICNLLLLRGGEI